MNTALRIPRIQLVPLFEWLAALPLSGRESRERTKFNQMIAEGLKEIDEDRLKILETYAELDPETGEKKKAVDNGVEHFVIPDDQKEAFAKEVNDLYAEEFVLDVLEGNKQKVKTIRDILLNTDYKFGPKEGDTQEQKIAHVREANNYDAWCTAFEAVDFDAE